MHICSVSEFSAPANVLPFAHDPSRVTGKRGLHVCRRKNYTTPARVHVESRRRRGDRGGSVLLCQLSDKRRSDAKRPCSTGDSEEVAIENVNRNVARAADPRWVNTSWEYYGRQLQSTCLQLSTHRVNVCRSTVVLFTMSPRAGRGRYGSHRSRSRCPVASRAPAKTTPPDAPVYRDCITETPSWRCFHNAKICFRALKCRVVACVFRACPCLIRFDLQLVMTDLQPTC